MAHFLLTSFGSFGDLHPYVALGSELVGRGHRVTIATSAVYRPKVESEGLGFHPVRPDVSLDDREMLALVMDQRHGSEQVVRILASSVRESYADTLAAAEHADVIVTHPATFASVLVAQKLGIPWISTVLFPLSFFSAHDPPVLAPAPWLSPLRVLGPAFMRFVWALGKRQSLSWIEPVLELRRELGLRSTENPMFEGQHSPVLVLALFSRYLAAPQPDWPPQTVVTGFPFYDRGELSPELERFLEDGPAPIVFTLGSSAVGAAGDFYVQSFAAVERLGARAVFLTGSHPQGLPDTLPRGVMNAAYAPHSAIFPRAAAIVHQGGIGTTAQAMRSGRPMLVVPFAHDQFDNGECVRRLGVAEVIYRSRYDARRARRFLQRLLSVPTYEQAASTLGAKVRTENGATAAADAMEAVL